LSFFVVQNDDLDDADGGPVDGTMASQHQDIHSSLPTEVFGSVNAYAGDSLVTPPCKVCTVHLCNIILRLYIMLSVSKLYCMMDLEGMEI
jgi:hypothetical protein